MNRYEQNRIEEYQIPEETHVQIRDLLMRCFSEYPVGRSYYQQVPAFRYLVYDDKRLVGHMSVEHRVINIDGQVAPIFGIGDFCVDPDYQLQHIASDLLAKIEQEALNHRIDFIILAANEHGFYQKKGYEIRDNTCRWLLINKQQTLGVGQRNIDKCIMVKATGQRQWALGLLDFLGPIF